MPLLILFNDFFLIYPGDEEPKLIGLLLHAMIPAPIATTFVFCSVPLILPHVDPTYFLFRNISSLSSIPILFCRLFIISISTLHGSVLIYTCIIYGTNIYLMFHISLKSMINQKLFEDVKYQEENGTSTITDFKILIRVSKFGLKFGRIPSFARNLLKYRQLQVMITILNQIAFVILPFSMMVLLVCCVACGYMLIKLTGSVPFPITLLSMFVICLFVTLVHFMVPLMVEVTVRSNDFIRLWKLRRVSAYRRKQLESFRLIRISIGPFGYVTKGLKILCFSLALYHTVSMVVLL